MQISFLIIAVVTLASGIAAMSLRNLVHCALCLTMTFAGLAALYLHLNAEFVGFAQILIYIGAVAILVVFAILLTRSEDSGVRGRGRAMAWWTGPLIALLCFATLAGALVSSSVFNRAPAQNNQAPVNKIGAQLLDQYLLPLEVVGLLLTAALIGAVILAMPERRKVQ